MYINRIIQTFFDTYSIEDYTKKNCGIFELALGKAFPSTKYYEIYTDSYQAIHYFVTINNIPYDVYGSYKSIDSVCDDLGYYSQDYDNEEIKVQQIDDIDIKGFNTNDVDISVKYIKEIIKDLYQLSCS